MEIEETEAVEEPRYNPIGRFNFGSMSQQHELVACRECAAVVPDEPIYRDHHTKWHDKNR